MANLLICQSPRNKIFVINIKTMKIGERTENTRRIGERNNHNKPIGARGSDVNKAVNDNTHVVIDPKVEQQVMK